MAESRDPDSWRPFCRMWAIFKTARDFSSSGEILAPPRSKGSFFIREISWFLLTKVPITLVKVAAMKKRMVRGDGQEGREGWERERREATNSVPCPSGSL